MSSALTIYLAAVKLFMDRFFGRAAIPPATLSLNASTLV